MVRRAADEKPGVGVDASGNPAVDPTKNVEALVKALEEKTRELRASDKECIDTRLSLMEKFMDFARDSESKQHHASRNAETRRIDELATTRQEFQNTIRDMLAESVRTTSTLVSTQLVQIQATFDTRVSKLEAFQWQSAGRSSVADPQIENALTRMNLALSTMQETGVRGGGVASGRDAANARLAAGVLGVIAFMSMAFGGYAVLRPSPPPQPVVQYVPAPTATPAQPAPVTVPR